MRFELQWLSQRIRSFKTVASDPGINPADISGARLVAIHDLDTYNTLSDGSGTVPGDGDPIGRRTPQVGDPMIQTESANRPLWRTGGMDCNSGGFLNCATPIIFSSAIGVAYFTITWPESGNSGVYPIAATVNNNIGYIYIASNPYFGYIDIDEYSGSTVDISVSSSSLIRVRLIEPDAENIYVKSPYDSEEIAVPISQPSNGFQVDTIGMSYEGGDYGGAYIRDLCILPSSTTPEELAGVEQWFRLRGFDISP